MRLMAIQEIKLILMRDQVDLDDVDEDDVPTATMRTMAIGDVRP
jgi:hypothetical protein